MRTALDAWGARQNGSPKPLYWVLRLQLAETGLARGVTVQDVLGQVPSSIRAEVDKFHEAGRAYWADVRYASLEPITQLWGTIVNSLRVVTNSDRATAMQRKVFAYPAEALVAFFRACRERMEVADGLYHSFKAMPAPELQALAALLNVHVDANLDVPTMVRLVKLLDHEGPMSTDEHEDLSAISNTHLVDAAFRGLRSNA
ncbi:MAG TPA: hypothetical protein VL172_23590 [Kofleriaceae bacterium]|nr:hypothetical protein [Kofleriaceae bacterium]